MLVRKPLYTTVRTLSVATALSVIFAGSAYALDGNDVAKRLQARFEEQGAKVEFGKVETNGATITLRDTKVDFKTAETGQITLGDVVLNNVSEDGKGGYLAETAVLQDIEKTENNSLITVKGIEIGKLHIAADGEQDPVVKMMYYQSMKADSLNVTEDGQQVVAMKDLYASTTPYTKGTPLAFSFGVKAIDVDLEAMETIRQKADEAAKAEAEKAVTRSDTPADADTDEEDEDDTDAESTPNPLLEIGYKKLSMALTSTAAWEPEKGDLAIDKLEVDIKDLGKFNTSLKLGGYDMKFVKSAQQTGEQLSANNEASDAAGMAMLGLVQQLSISAMAIDYTDQSLTPKLLDYYAKQQGIGRDDMVNQIKGIAPLMIGFLGHADFAVQATTAINSYLDKPQNLTLAAQPPAPVSFALIAATATADPKKLLDLLNVKIIANQ